MTFLMKWLLPLFCLAIGSQAFGQPNDPSQIAPFDYHRDFKPIFDRTKNRYDTLYYLKLLTRFQNNDSSLTRAETLALLIGYTDNQYFKPYADMMTEKEIVKLNDDGYYLDALDESKKYLQTHPLSLSTLKERSYAYYKLKKRDSARYFMSLADKIMEAMIYSGKGKSPETAFFSLGLADGDYFIPNVGLSVSGRKTGKDKWRNFLYIIDAVSLEDVHNTYFFNIQHAKLKMDNEEDPDAEATPVQKVPRKQRGVPPVKPDTISVPAPVITPDIPQPPADSIPSAPAPIPEPAMIPAADSSRTKQELQQ